MKKLINGIKHFLEKEIWVSNFNQYPKGKRFFLQQLRVILVAFRGFKEDNVLLRSSALTFYTLISIVPIIAMAFGISKGFGFEDRLNHIIINYFSHQPETGEYLVQFSHRFLENTKGGLVAGIGVVLLFWSVMKVLSNIELSFNAVWGITQARSLVRKFTEYLSIMLIGPIFVIFSSGVTIFISSAANHVLGDNNAFYGMASIAKIGIELIPYVLIWILFTFLYMAIPNTKVKFKYAAIAAVIAGSGFNALEWVYFTFQIGAVKYNAIYGSFAALPLFLVWVQSSWIIVLFGCEIAFAGQHIDRYIYEKEVDQISHSHLKKVKLLILHHIDQRFLAGKNAQTANEIAKELSLPIRLAQASLRDLKETGLLSETFSENKEVVAYQPAKNIGEMPLTTLVLCIEQQGNNNLPITKIAEFRAIEAALVSAGKPETIAKSKTLRNLLD